ncbi:hypothetical protein [Proteiniphilum sp. X52]|uniref:hypothetical protein n=1 Tax=Proteiniphilum sp. X52 TaxID=2382159 RepID=UPI001C882716|nr:hypothetical protein [Proteiniphilum sp. X52]
MLVDAGFGRIIHRFSGIKGDWVHLNSIDMTTPKTTTRASRLIRIIPVIVSTCDFCGKKTTGEMWDYEGFKICGECNRRYNDFKTNKQ